MTITKNSKGITKKDVYRLTHSQSTRKMSDAVGSILKVDAWVLYTDIDGVTNEEKEVITIASEGEVFGTISKTFIREFCDIIDAFEDEPELSIRVVSGKTRAGRTFITCEIA